MTESKEFIRAKLVSRTNADCSVVQAKNNRWHYYLQFGESIGWDWVEGQIYKTNGDLDVEVEPWEIHPSGVQAFEIEVREVERREGIDDSQRGLSDFEP